MSFSKAYKSVVQFLNEYHHIYSCLFLFLEILVILLFLEFPVWLVGLILFIGFIFLIRPHYKRLKAEKTFRFNEWLDEYISNDLSDYEIFIRTFPIVLTLILATSINRFKENTELFFTNIKQLDGFSTSSIDFGLIIFWVLLVFWLLFFPKSITSMNSANGRKLKKILSSIHRAPNNELFLSYPKLYKTMIEGLREASKLKTEVEKADEIDIIEMEIEIILNTITEVVRYFSPYDDDKEKIGANVWLLLNKTDDQDIISKLPDNLDFKTVHKSDEVSGVAILVKNLILKDDEDSNFKIKKYLSLPIPNFANEQGELKALPGVPYASLEGFSIINNIAELENRLSDFSSEVRESIVDYFKSGNGRNINSFASFRIGDETTPIGVLNLDSNHDNIMGDKNFLYTFIAVIEPIMRLLDQRIIRFLELYRKSDDFPWSE